MNFNIVSKHRSVIMGFAALWVFYFHTAPLLIGNSSFFGKLEWFLKRSGYCGVDIFILLLSFGLYFSFSRNEKFNVVKYVKKRLVRILPAYIAVLAVYTAVNGLGGTYFFKTLFFVTQFGTDMYSFLWFVPCVLIFYAAAPIYFSMLKKTKHRFLLPAVCSLIVCFLCKKYGYLVRGDLYCIISRIPIFLSGFLAGYLADKRVKIGPVVAAIALAAIFLGMKVNYVLNMGYRDPYLPYGNCFINIFTAWGIMILIPVICEFFEKQNFFAAIKKAASFYGGISFEFYCVQELIYTLITQKLDGVLPFGRRYQVLIFFVVLFFSTVAANLMCRTENGVKAKINAGV